LIAFLLATALSEGPVFRTASVEVMPEELLPLGGYTARKDAKMEPGGEKLFARALVIESGKARFAVVSLEALTVPESLYQAVKSRIPEDVGLFLTATHTHSAPDSQLLNERMTFKVPGIASFSRRWLDWYAGRVASCVNDALAAEPVDARSASLATAQVDANRGRRTGAIPSKTASYVRVGARVFLSHYSAHGTIYDEKRNTTSGDWPGAVARDIGGLVLTGAIGDVSPDFPTPSSVDNLTNMVDKLRSGLAGAQVMGLFANDDKLAWVEEGIRLDKPFPHPDFNKSFGAPPPLDQVLVGRFAPTEASVFVLKIGSLLMIGVPGEPTSEVGRELQAVCAKAGFPQVLVVSHTNGWLGYILTPSDYDKGGYEATLSFHGRETSIKLQEAVERAVKKLAHLPRVAQVR
jgi:hypothetical protein